VFIRLEAFVSACHSDSYNITASGFVSSHVWPKQPKLVQEGGELQFGSYYFDNRSWNQQLVLAYKKSRTTLTSSGGGGGSTTKSRRGAG
jgi:hypothetical protein